MTDYVLFPEQRPFSGSPPTRQPRRSNSRRGSSLVEGALVLLPFMALMLGIIDFAMPIFLQSLFANAVREGVRYAVTHQTTFNGTSYSTQSAAIKAVVQSNSLGFLTGTSASAVQVKYFASMSPFGERTGTGANKSGNIVEVSVNGFNWTWIAPIWRTSSPLSISVSSSDRLEPIAGGGTLPTP